MRTREEIEIPEGEGFSFESQGQRAILEVLLDIRDLLTPPTSEARLQAIEDKQIEK